MPRTSALHTRRVNYDQALQLLREWQRDIGLRDWTLRLEITRSIAPWHGNFIACEKKTCALVQLLCPTAADETEIEPLDHEVALVHELHHVKLGIKHPRDSHLDILEEQAIHQLSKCMVAMKRELRKLRRKPICHIP
jgi:hypothetical protein